MTTYHRAPHRLALLLGHPGDPVDAPDLAEHGAVREAEAEREEPRAEAARHRVQGGTDDAAVEPCSGWRGGAGEGLLSPHS